MNMDRLFGATAVIGLLLILAVIGYVFYTSEFVCGYSEQELQQHTEKVERIVADEPIPLSTAVYMKTGRLTGEDYRCVKQHILSDENLYLRGECSGWQCNYTLHYMEVEQ